MRLIRLNSAYSSSRPVSRPAAARSNRPPSGSATASSTPSAVSAAELRMVPWPLQARSITGWSGARPSSAARRAWASPSTAFEMVMLIHSPAGVRATAARRLSRTRAAGGSAVGLSDMATRVPGSSGMMWAWASLSPGITTRPSRSTRVAPGDAAARMSPLVPTCTIRSPRISTASAQGWFGSMVKNRPLWSTRSGSAPASPHAVTASSDSSRAASARGRWVSMTGLRQEMGQGRGPGGRAARRVAACRLFPGRIRGYLPSHRLLLHLNRSRHAGSAHLH